MEIVDLLVGFVKLNEMIVGVPLSGNRCVGQCLLLSVVILPKNDTAYRLTRQAAIRRDAGRVPARYWPGQLNRARFNCLYGTVQS